MKTNLIRIFTIMSVCIFASSSTYLQSSQNEELVLFQFENKSEQKAWNIVNDDVMGGISTSQVRVKDGSAFFTGNVSLENNGGFASTRALMQKGKISGYNAIKIRVKGDGKKYKLSLRSGNGWNNANHQITFPTKNEKWVEHTLMVKDLKPSWRGRSLSLPDMKPSDARLIGLSISDKQSGAFQLEIDWIKAVKVSTESKSIIGSI